MDAQVQPFNHFLVGVPISAKLAEGSSFLARFEELPVGPPRPPLCSLHVPLIVSDAGDGEVKTSRCVPGPPRAHCCRAPVQVERL